MAPMVLPAYAGMIRQMPLALLPWTCAPRVCGDDPKDAAVARYRA